MRRITTLAVVLVLVAAACGGSESTDAVEPADTSPETVDPSPETVDPADDDEDAPVDGEANGESSSAAIMVAEGWAVQNLGAGAKPVLALDADDRPAVAWLSESIGEGFVSFASASEGWAEEQIVEGYFYGPIGLDFDPNDAPHVVYHDHQADTFQDHLGDLAHAFRADGSWTADAAADDGHDGWDSTVAIGPDGIVRAAGIDPQQFSSQDGVEYYELGADGWSVTAIGSGPIEYEWNVALAVSDSGQVGMSYFNNNSADLIFASLTDGTWQLETVDAEGDVGRFSSLVFDDDGNPHVSYYANDGTIRYATRTIDGWSIEDVGQLEAVEIAFSGARRITAIDLDSNASPHIVFGDLEVVRHATRGDDGWVVADVLQAAGTPLGQLVSLAIGSNDAVHIATPIG